MTQIGGMDGAELARHLRDPEGASGLAVIGGLAAVNAEGSALALEQLGVGSGMAVLELGCGLGELAAAVTASGESVRYVGVDRSETMVAAAVERHAQAIASDNTEFHLSTSEDLPFAGDAFDRVFSLGLIHFWTDPATSLAEIRRVMRPAGRMVMGCLGPDRAPPFALADNGFHLRPAEEWRDLCLSAGFERCDVAKLDDPERPQGLLVIADV